jgi:hypothetical protein
MLFDRPVADVEQMVEDVRPEVVTRREEIRRSST